jgi:hypothetical protein
MLLRVKTVAFLVLLALSLHAQRPAPRPQSALVIQGLGQGQIKLNGFWQFHTGDDPWWATPSFDDSRWEPITASDSWGNQGHSGYTGFAWYRRHLENRLAPGANTAYALMPGAGLNQPIYALNEISLWFLLLCCCDSRRIAHWSAGRGWGLSIQAGDSGS